MQIPEYSMRQLLEAGVHFGHRTDRWNPLMAPYIYGARSGIHVIDLTQTVPLLHQALVAIHQCVAKGGRLLMVGTKSQARVPVRETAEQGQQFYIDNRWLGGTLTNWKTVSGSLDRLDRLEQMLDKPDAGFAKKERLRLERHRDKLRVALGGIRKMKEKGIPEMLFVIDVKQERLAIQEAIKTKIPVAAIVDTNCDPTGIDYPIPGNDDASRAVVLYCDLVLRVLLDAVGEQLASISSQRDDAVEVPLEGGSESAAEEPVDKKVKTPAAETKPQPVVAAEAEMEPQAEIAAEATGDVKTEPQAEIVAEATGDVKAEPQAEIAAEATGDVKTEPQAEIVAETTGDVKTEPQADSPTEEAEAVEAPTPSS